MSLTSSRPRALFESAADLVDEFRLKHLASEATLEETAKTFAEVQAAKTFINESAARVVDRSRNISGGSGCMAKDSSARAYRDVRAGDLMQPLSSVRAYDFIGSVALGRFPALS